MLICCTKKLLDQLNIKPAPCPDVEPLFSWHANLLRINRRKTVVLVNDKNRYAIVLYGLKAGDFKKLDQHIAQAIRLTFQEECIRDEVIEQFVNHYGQVTFTKTRGRTPVARMNNSCQMVLYGHEDLMVEGIYQIGVGIRVSRLLAGDGLNRYIRPNEEMYKDLADFAAAPIFSCPAAALKITLDLDEHQVWRQIVLPLNTTFDQLHQVIQIAFGWQNYHLHEFFIYGQETLDSGAFINHNHSGYHKEGFKPIINLVSNEDAFDYADKVGGQMILEAGIKLSEYVPAKMKYIYDFGDNWQHYIEVEKVLADYDKNHPVCLAGAGNTPPEDVGGQHGYEEFLKIIADKNHPEYEHMATWGNSQGYRDFDIEMVNRRLETGW